ncbi:hypothetical protein THALO_460180 [Tenacibaculum halocynthiae]
MEVLIIPVGNTQMLFFLEHQTDKKPKKTAIISREMSSVEELAYWLKRKSKIWFIVTTVRFYNFH